jgi:hypothetical protein
MEEIIIYIGNYIIPQVDEWKARDLEAARRWSEQQEQLAAYAARIAELENLLGRSTNT